MQCFHIYKKSLATVQLCRNWIIALAWLRKGFCEIIKKVLKIAPFGMLFGGPPCGSWVYINRYTSKRTAQRIFGDCNRAYVRHANTSLSYVYIKCTVTCVYIFCGVECRNYPMSYRFLICTYLIWYHVWLQKVLFFDCNGLVPGGSWAFLRSG